MAHFTLHAYSNGTSNRQLLGYLLNFPDYMICLTNFGGFPKLFNLFACLLLGFVYKSKVNMLFSYSHIKVQNLYCSWLQEKNIHPCLSITSEVLQNLKIRNHLSYLTPNPIYSVIIFKPWVYLTGTGCPLNWWEFFIDGRLCLV